MTIQEEEENPLNEIGGYRWEKLIGIPRMSVPRIAKMVLTLLHPFYAQKWKKIVVFMAEKIFYGGKVS